MPNEPGAFGVLANAIGDAGGTIGAVDMHSVAKGRVVRDVTVGVASEAVANDLRRAVEAIDGTRIVFANDSTFLAHVGGKIRVDSKIAVKNRQDLSTVYTPGVARVSMAIAADPSKAFQLTIKRNTVAVVTDGTAVLGLGDIGPLGALPVMEGKAMLFKQFAGHRRVSDLPRHQGRRRDRRDGRAHRARSSAASTWKTSARRAASRSRTG